LEIHDHCLHFDLVLVGQRTQHGQQHYTSSSAPLFLFLFTDGQQQQF
jgi:hypothetical protein